MDAVESTNDFQDWEMLQTSSGSGSTPLSSPDLVNSFDEIDSGGLIQANYFSLDSENRYVEHVHDGESVGSDNPGWNDPGFGEELARLSEKEPGGFWPDLSSERSADHVLRDLVMENESKIPEKGEKEVKFEVVKGKEEEAEDFGDSFMDSCGISGDSFMDSGGISGDSGEFSDLGDHSEVGVEVNMNLNAESPTLGEDMNENEGVACGGGVVDGAERRNSGELEKNGIVWWKMPMEFVKYCVIRMSPVWTVSVGAAVMGFLILGSRLYKMKRKTRGLEIKVAVDDKKASQVMSRAARLNEAFSVVKLVPVIRPSLPAVGSSSNLTVMSLR